MGSPNSLYSLSKKASRITLGGVLLTAGIGHLSTKRQEFQAQVPDWVPAYKDAVVLASGAVEVALGAALIALPRQQVFVGRVAATFFTLILPGNISQFVTKTSAFGLDTDRKRAIRLLFQPLLVAWALWSTRAICKN